MQIEGILSAHKIVLKFGMPLSKQILSMAECFSVKSESRGF